MIGLLFGERLVVGIEPDAEEPELTRIYIDARYEKRFVLAGEEDAERIRRAWASTAHLTINLPAGTPIYRESEEES